MKELGLLLVGVVVIFGCCYLVDQGFTRIFRNKSQHHSGRSVRLNSKYGAFGLILIVLGVASVLAGIGGRKILWIGGIFVGLVGAAMVTYFMTFGVYYDDDTFLYSAFGKKSRVYRYSDIRTQQLFAASGGTVIELYLADGRSLALQSSMTGTFAFLDQAFASWCAQTGKDPSECDFYDPDNTCYFPPTEVK